MATLFHLLRTAFYMTAFVGLWACLAFEVRSLDESSGIAALPPILSTPGLVLIGLGLTIDLACGWEFSVRGRGTPALFDAPREFVATGPYRVVRNPMYVGAIMAFIGLALTLQSLAVLALALVFALLVHLLVIFYEEPHLEEIFGDSYRAYQKRVHRWLPMVHKPSALGGWPSAY